MLLEVGIELFQFCVKITLRAASAVGKLITMCQLADLVQVTAGMAVFDGELIDGVSDESEVSGAGAGEGSIREVPDSREEHEFFFFQVCEQILCLGADREIEFDQVGIAVAMVRRELSAVFEEDRQGFADVLVVGLQDIFDQANRRPAVEVQLSWSFPEHGSIQGGEKLAFGDTGLFCGFGQRLAAAAAVVDPIFLKYFGLAIIRGGNSAYCG